MYSNDLVCNILEYIEKFINTKITIEDFEHNFFYNRYYIMKLFKKEIGVTIFNYINKLRIYNSTNDINNTNDLLIKIAMNNGFYSLEYFSETFKKEIGISPRDYKNIKLNKYYKSNEKALAIKNILEIRKLIKKTKKYKERRKREILPVKKLSIFK